MASPPLPPQVDRQNSLIDFPQTFKVSCFTEESQSDYAVMQQTSPVLPPTSDVTLYPQGDTAGMAFDYDYLPKILAVHTLALPLDQDPLQASHRHREPILYTSQNITGNPPFHANVYSAQLLSNEGLYNGPHGDALVTHPKELVLRYNALDDHLYDKDEADVAPAETQPSTNYDAILTSPSTAPTASTSSESQALHHVKKSDISDEDEAMSVLQQKTNYLTMDEESSYASPKMEDKSLEDTMATDPPAESVEEVVQRIKKEPLDDYPRSSKENCDLWKNESVGGLKKTSDSPVKEKRALYVEGNDNAVYNALMTDIKVEPNKDRNGRALMTDFKMEPNKDSNSRIIMEPNKDGNSDNSSTSTNKQATRGPGGSGAMINPIQYRDYPAGIWYRTWNSCVISGLHGGLPWPWSSQASLRLRYMGQPSLYTAHAPSRGINDDSVSVLTNTNDLCVYNTRETTENIVYRYPRWNRASPNALDNMTGDARDTIQGDMSDTRISNPDDFGSARDSIPYDFTGARDSIPYDFASSRDTISDDFTSARATISDDFTSARDTTPYDFTGARGTTPSDFTCARDTIPDDFTSARDTIPDDFAGARRDILMDGDPMMPVVPSTQENCVGEGQNIDPIGNKGACRFASMADVIPSWHRESHTLSCSPTAEARSHVSDVVTSGKDRAVESLDWTLYERMEEGQWNISAEGNLTHEGPADLADNSGGSSSSPVRRNCRKKNRKEVLKNSNKNIQDCKSDVKQTSDVLQNKRTPDNSTEAERSGTKKTEKLKSDHHSKLDPRVSRNKILTRTLVIKIEGKCNKSQVGTGRKETRHNVNENIKSTASTSRKETTRHNVNDTLQSFASTSCKETTQHNVNETNKSVAPTSDGKHKGRDNKPKENKTDESKTRTKKDKINKDIIKGIKVGGSSKKHNAATKENYEKRVLKTSCKESRNKGKDNQNSNGASVFQNGAVPFAKKLQPCKIPKLVNRSHSTKEEAIKEHCAVLPPPSATVTSCTNTQTEVSMVTGSILTKQHKGKASIPETSKTRNPSKYGGHPLKRKSFEEMQLDQSSCQKKRKHPKKDRLEEYQKFVGQLNKTWKTCQGLTTQQHRERLREEEMNIRQKKRLQKAATSRRPRSSNYGNSTSAKGATGSRATSNDAKRVEPLRHTNT